MNKISQNLLNYIQNNHNYHQKIQQYRTECYNLKDFQNQVGYVIMDIVSREKKFFDINRNDINIAQITQELF